MVAGALDISQWASFIDARSRRIAERPPDGRAMRGLSEAGDSKDLDTNGDGNLSREEFDADTSRRGLATPNAARTLNHAHRFSG